MAYQKKKLTLQEALDYLDELSSDDENGLSCNLHALYIQPPENDGDLSGEDDADEGKDSIPDNVCPAQLRSGCEMAFENGERLENLEVDRENLDYILEDSVLANVINNTSLNLSVNSLQTSGPTEITPHKSLSPHLSRIHQSSSSCPLPTSNKNTVFTWLKDESCALTPIFPKPNYQDCKNLKPHEQFEKFIDDVLLQNICDCSEVYATYQKKKISKIAVNELRVFIGILLVSGYTGQTSYRDMWSNDTDLRNDMVYNSMRRNRFEEILQSLHFEPNVRAPQNVTDKLWKLRPITDHIKSKMLEHFHPEQNLSFDESMIAYFGKHGCKQFIRGKPIRFGYKVWSLCTPSGYLLNFEVYQGKNPRSNSTYEELFGKCAAPLVNMIDDFSDKVQELPFSFYFDNLFTSFPLLTYLKNRGYNGTGTIRENRIPKSCPIPHKKKFKTKPRGYYKSIKMNETGIRLTKWVDNSVVCMLSTHLGSTPTSIASRYSKHARKKIGVTRPCVVSEYNQYMCGVDRFDQNVAAYRIAYRGKKWWSCIFTWIIDACVQNAWQLHRRINPDMPQKQFKREIAIYYCKHFGDPPKSHSSVSSLKRRSESTTLATTLRYDQTNHLVIPLEKKRRCAGDLCNSIVRTACTKCDKGLCLRCFKPYHTKE